MHTQSSHYATPMPVWFDGTDGQEDELDDVHKGILDAPTDDEGPGSIDENNSSGVADESADEGNDIIERMLKQAGIQNNN